MIFSYQKTYKVIKGAKPSAISLSAGYTFKLKNHDSRIELGYQRTHKAYNVNMNTKALQLPRYRLDAIYGIHMYQHTILAIEYARDHDYAKHNGGTNKVNHIIDLRVTLCLF